MFTLFVEQPRPNTKPTADTIQRHKTNRWVMPRGLRAGVRSVHHASNVHHARNVHHASNPSLRASVRANTAPSTRAARVSAPATSPHRRRLRTGDGLCAPSTRAAGASARESSGVCASSPWRSEEKMTRACPTTGVGALPCPSGVRVEGAQRPELHAGSSQSLEAQRCHKGWWPAKSSIAAAWRDVVT